MNDLIHSTMNAQPFALRLQGGNLTAPTANRLAQHYHKPMPAMWATTTLITREDGISLCLTAAPGQFHLSIEGADGMLIRPTSRRLLELFGIQTNSQSA